MSPAITFENVTLGYDRHPAVHHLRGVVEHGEMLAIIGPNGAGKSTLIKGIAGLLKPLEGTITLAAEAENAVAYLPQTTAIDPTFPIDLTDFVNLGLWREIGLLRRIGAPHAARVRAAIAKVGLEGYQRRGLSTLSGGQLQRALFARLIVQDPQIVLLDEPFAAIDRSTTTDLCALLQEWKSQGRTIVAVLHDFEQVRTFFSRTLLLAREVVAWGRTESILAPGSLAQTLSLAEQRLAAFDDAAAECERDPVPGEAA